MASYQAQEANAAKASWDINSYNQLTGFAQNTTAQVNNYQTQMSQAFTIYTQKNSCTLPSDFPNAPNW